MRLKNLMAMKINIEIEDDEAMWMNGLLHKIIEKADSGENMNFSDNLPYAILLILRDKFKNAILQQIPTERLKQLAK